MARRPGYSLGHGKYTASYVGSEINDQRRFNKIGNREMYMNCAVVKVVPKGYKDDGDKDKRGEPELSTLGIEKRDTQHANAAAQKALAPYPGLFVANLEGINDCVTKETQDVIFDTPGKSVQYADGQKSSAKASFDKGKCTGKGSKSAGSSSPDSSSPPPSSPGGDNGQWQPSSSSKQSDGTNCNDGQYHPACFGGADAQKVMTADSKPTAESKSSTPAQVKSAPKEQGQQQVTDVKTGGQPSSKVEKELDAYLKKLYGNKHSKRAACKNTSHEPCHAPSRWIKRGECTWRCERRGRASTIHKTTPKQKQIEQKLSSLEEEMKVLVELVKSKKEAKNVKRQDVNAEEPFFHTTSFPAGGAPEALGAAPDGQEPTFQPKPFPFRGAPGGPLEHTFQLTSFPVQAAPGAEEPTFQTTSFPVGGPPAAEEPAPYTFQTLSSSSGEPAPAFLPTTLQPEDAAPVLLATTSAPVDAAPLPAVSTTPTPMTIDAFLDYYSRVQTMMMDYIRSLAASFGGKKRSTRRKAEEPSFSTSSLPFTGEEAPGTFEPSAPGGGSDPVLLSATSTPVAAAPVTAISTTSAPLDSTFDLFLDYLSRLQTTMIECIRNLTTTAAPTLIDVTPDVQAIPAQEDPATALNAALSKPSTLATKRQLVPPAVSMNDWIESLDLPLDIQDNPVFTGLKNLGLEWEDLYNTLRPEGDNEPSSEDAISPELEIEPLEDPQDSNATDPFTTSIFHPSISASDSVADSQLSPPYANSSSPTNTTDTPDILNALQAAADESSFSAALAADKAQNSPPNSTSNSTSNLESMPTITPESDAASLLPLFMGPGPVVPPGMSIDWPGPNTWPDEHTNEHETTGSNLENMPMLTDDLGPADEQQVKDFFAELGKQDDANGEGGVGNLEHMPMVVDDLGPESGDGVRKFFAGMDHNPVEEGDVGGGDVKDGSDADGDGGEGDDVKDDVKDGSNLKVPDLGPEGEKEVNDFIAKLSGVKM
jgi:hypothetical protein